MTMFVPAEPFPPGEYIQDELDARGWTHGDLAEVTGITRRQIINLIKGKSGITPETAFALADAFGQDARTWMDLQTAYELATVAKKNRHTARRAKIFNKLPLKEVVSRGWIQESKDIDELESSVCKFLDITSIDDVPCMPRVAARKATPYDVDTAAQLAWYRRCWQLAEHAPASTYDESHLEDGIKELLKLASFPEDARRVPRALQDMGIRFVINQHLIGTKIDGVAFWLDPQSPAIAVSLRFGRIDNFWFNLLHEIVHIKYRHHAPIDTNMDAQKCDLDEIERIANREAGNYLIPADKLESFVKRHVYYQTRVVQFAQLHGVHPGIAVGQLHHHPEGLEPRQLRKLLVPVRGHVLGQAITDGWGNMPNLEDKT